MGTEERDNERKINRGMIKEMRVREKRKMKGKFINLEMEVERKKKKSLLRI